MTLSVYRKLLTRSNRYAYVQNNPVNSVDPSGLLTLLVHGTGNDPNEHEWARINSDFWRAVRDTFGEDPIPFDWREYSGALQVSFLEGYIGIIKGGLKLADFLNNIYPFAEGEKLNIVAHSHGGNIVKLASLLMNRQIDNLVTLGTPQNTDLAPINFHRAAKNHCSVSSLVDYKQFYGASPTQVALTGYYTGLGFAHGYASINYWWMSISALSYPYYDPSLAAYYQGLSVYHAKLSAEYLGLAAVSYLSTRINPLAHRNVILGYESHHDLITAETWIDNSRKGCGL